MMRNIFPAMIFGRNESRFSRLSAFMAFMFCVTSTAFWTGCQKGPEPTYHVAGKVLLDGKPLSIPGTIGTVLFTSSPNGEGQHGYTARGIIQKDGSYHLSTFAEADGAVAGLHRVTVTVSSLSMPSAGQADASSLLPRRYSSPNTSGLEVDVKPESNHIDLNLTRQKQ